ncbi:type VI secretion system tube protein Hcp [Anaeromyxobacter oryzae]|uniref:Uncharacterized protein n=1 Tax=Anaeromyxobacter oryzae TaxID=2918170 RepID=A0ABN6MW45_9BACT|nr:type VI secretion system tube protein Hcp [Anaeromyxobacter oryzae]BDG05177.1 hypothetical protein AMOR_41730 [Anaeromyxobacter oryzae]
MKNAKRNSRPAAATLEPLGDDVLTAVSGGRVNLSSISITKVVDKASAKLFTACASGSHIKEATLVL